MSNSGGDLDNSTDITTQLSDGYQPNPAVAVVGTSTPLLDASQRLETRAAVLTDEGSFRDDFSGNAISSEWTTTLTGAGTAVSVSNSYVTVSTPNGNNRAAQIFRAADYLPYNMSGALYISQRVANQITLFGFLDDAATTSKQALFEFSGTTNTQVICRSSSSSAATDTQSTTITLPSGTTATQHIYRIDVTATSVVFTIDDVIVATHREHIPGPYDFLGNVLSITNTGNVNGTTVSMDWFSLSNSNQIEVTNGFNEAFLTKQYPNPATYSAAILALAAANNATDIFTITGSATRIVKVTSISFNATQTAAGTVATQLVKRSTANTAGTSTTPIAVPHDSSSVAATAVVRAYTANPTTGTLVGAVRSARVFIPTATALGGAQEYQYGIRFTQPIVLRGVTEVLALNLNGVTVTGNSFSISVEWTEE